MDISRSPFACVKLESSVLCYCTVFITKAIYLNAHIFFPQFNTTKLQVFIIHIFMFSLCCQCSISLF